MNNQSFLIKNRLLMALAGLVIAGFMVWYFHTVVLYILIAAALSFIGGPLVRQLQRITIGQWSAPRWLAALVTLLVLMFLFVLGMWLVVPLVLEKINYFAQIETAQFSSSLTEITETIDAWFAEKMPLSNITIEGLYNQYIEPHFSAGAIGSALSSVAGMAVSFSMAVFSVSFITYFFLKDDKLFTEGVVTLLPKRYEENVMRAINSSVNLLGRYFIGICLESLIKFVVVCFSLYFLGLDFGTSMIVGMVTGVLNVIPYIGPLVGWGISVILVVLSPATASLASSLVELSVVLLVFQLLDNIILQPYIYSSSVKAHPLEIFIVILMAGYIGGIVGMLVAIPCYTVLRVFAKEFFANLRVVQRLTEKL